MRLFRYIVKFRGKGVAPSFYRLIRSSVYGIGKDEWPVFLSSESETFNPFGYTSTICSHLKKVVP